MNNRIGTERGRISPSECISDAWELIKEDYWLFFGICLLAWVMFACIPCVNIFLLGPIWVGIYFCFFTKMRNQPVEFGMMFKGFEKIVPAMVVGLLASIPEILQQVLQLSLNVIDLAGILGKGKKGEFFMQTDNIFAGGLGILLIAVGIGLFIVFIVWKITFYFALGLIAEYDLDIFEAIKISAGAAWSNIIGIIILAILLFLLSLLGALALCIGVFFVMPIVFGSYAVAFRQVFPDTNPNYQTINTPPPPSAYQNQFAG